MKFLVANIKSLIAKTNFTAKAKDSYKDLMDELKLKHCENLQHSLNQLEFISRFEMHLDLTKHENYSMQFLEEFSRIKYYAQINTIKSIEFCKN